MLHSRLWKIWSTGPPWLDARDYDVDEPQVVPLNAVDTWKARTNAADLTVVSSHMGDFDFVEHLATSTLVLLFLFWNCAQRREK